MPPPEARIKKIAVIGPECTGKSSLCRQLAEHYNSNWCPEFAREYLLKYGTKYSYDDLLTIAKGQIELEEKYSQLTTRDSRFLFVDTDMYVMKVWCEFVFGRCHPWILNQIVQRKYDLYLLCSTDLPWVKDELREYPDPGKRNQLYKMYYDLMINQSTPWAVIKGSPPERLKIAIGEIEKLFH